MKKILFITFLFLSLSISWAKIPSVVKLNQKLSKESAVVSKIAAEIKSLEKTLTKKNDSYLDNVKLIEKLESKVATMQKSLAAQAFGISEQYKKSRKALNLYLLESLDDENKNKLLHKKIYIEILNKKLSALKKAEEQSNSLLATINLYDQKLTKTKSDEEITYQLIMELENKKKLMSQNYISHLETKNRVESTLDQMKAKRRAKAKIAGGKTRSSKKSKKVDVFIPMKAPLDDYVAMIKKKDAVILKFKDTVQLKAPAAGRIVYSGELANYGDVIIIDHGKQVRSVLLGDLLIKVKKGDLVGKGQLLGYTVSDPGVIKSLRYEIRKKSKPVNALNWISNPKNIKL